MSKSVIKIFYFLIILVIFGIIGCASGPRGTLKIVKQPTETELKQDWQNYTVYHRRKLAYVYKIKNDRKIILDKSWIKVSSEDMMAKSKIFDQTYVKEIIGNGGEMFGYLVHRHWDTANVEIIDQKTVQLYYHYRVTEGGP